MENVRASDRGEYICTASNEYGTNSTKINLTVLSKLLTFFTKCSILVTNLYCLSCTKLFKRFQLMFFLAEPELLTDKDEFSETISIELGSNATLLCPFKNFDDFEWLKNGNVFNKSNSNSVDIVFHNISASDQGKTFSFEFFLISSSIETTFVY